MHIDSAKTIALPQKNLLAGRTVGRNPAGGARTRPHIY
jgi:hypothetical protein